MACQRRLFLCKFSPDRSVLEPLLRRFTISPGLMLSSTSRSWKKLPRLKKYQIATTTISQRPRSSEEFNILFKRILASIGLIIRKSPPDDCAFASINSCSSFRACFCCPSRSLSQRLIRTAALPATFASGVYPERAKLAGQLTAHALRPFVLRPGLGISRIDGHDGGTSTSEFDD